MSAFEIREGTTADIPDLLRLIKELAVFEKAADKVKNNEAMLKEDFEVHQSFKFLVAVKKQKVVGISLYYPRYSTWNGRCYYLEDLYVETNLRGEGIGLALLKATVEEAKKAGAARLDWQVLDWNTPAVEFYEKMGTHIEKEWWNCKLEV